MLSNEEKIMRRRLSRKKWKDEHPDYDREYREKNKERLQDKAKQYYQDNREVRLQKVKQYNDIHKEDKKKYDQKYWIENKDVKSAKNKNWDNCNKEKIRERRRYYRKTPNGHFATTMGGHRYREKSKALENTLTLQEWKEIIQHQNNRCIVCDREFGEHLKPTKDHIIPLSKSSDVGLTKENTQALCKSCNSAKHNKTFTPEEYEAFKKERKMIVQCDIMKQKEIKT